jgi:hypothetical protein
MAPLTEVERYLKVCVSTGEDVHLELMPEVWGRTLKELLTSALERAGGFGKGRLTVFQ